MDIDEDDDFYSPEEPAQATEQPPQTEQVPQTETKQEQEEEDLEEGEEEDEGSEGSDSDIDIITERKDGTKAAPPQPRYNEIRNIPQRNTASDVTAKLPAVKKETTSKGTTPVSGADLPAISTSKIDVNAKPVYEPAGKPITQVDIDEDLIEHEKPWRRPGTDITDYFNYGFDEFTWALYASKQEALRSEYDQEKIAQNNKKMFEDMNMMMAMGGIPGMPGMPAATGGAAMPGMEGIPPEMQQMMQQMMAQGIDPTQIDPATMFAGMQGAQAGAPAAGAQSGNQGQGFGAQGGFGQNPQMGFGYDQGMMNQGDTRNRGNFGKGRGGRRNW